ncbi:MAG: hypothetical protein RR144_03155 [Clostridia bacterium]
MRKTLIIIGITIGTIILIAIMVYFGNEYWIREKPKYNEIAYKIEEKENEIVETVYYPKNLNPSKVIRLYIYENDKLKKVIEENYYKNIVLAKRKIFPIQTNNEVVIQENIITTISEINFKETDNNKEHIKMKLKQNHINQSELFLDSKK